MVSAVDLWAEGIHWSLGVVEVNLPDFRFLRKHLQDVGATITDGYGDEYRHQLRSFLTAQMTAPCSPKQALGDSWLDGFRVLSRRFSESFPDLSVGTSRALKVCDDLFSMDSLVTTGLEHLCLDWGVNDAILVVRYAHGFEAVVAGVNASGLDQFITPMRWSDIRGNFVEQPVILCGPLGWHLNGLRVPPSDSVFVVQPIGFGVSFNPGDPFLLPNGRSFNINRMGPLSTRSLKVVMEARSMETRSSSLSEEDYKRSEVLKGSFESAPDNESEEPDQGGQKQVRMMTSRGPVDLKPTRNWFLTSRNSLESRDAHSADTVECDWYHVSRESGPVVSAEADWQQEMEVWRQWLRSGLKRKPSMTAMRFRANGGSREHRLGEWTDTVIPQDDTDFRALLICAGIKGTERQNYIIRMARRAHSDARQEGRGTVADEYQDLKRLVEEEGLSQFENMLDFQVRLENGALYAFSRVLSVDPYMVRVQHPDKKAAGNDNG